MEHFSCIDGVSSNPIRDSMLWVRANWQGLVICPPEMTHYERLACPIHRRGVYFLWGYDGDLLYVGKSNQLSQRLLKHIKDQRIGFKSYSLIPLEGMHDEVLSHVESAYIDALDPSMNIKAGTSCVDCQETWQKAIVKAWAPFRFLLLPDWDGERRYAYGSYSHAEVRETDPTNEAQMRRRMTGGSSRHWYASA